jgi:hypothetical protein
MHSRTAVLRYRRRALRTRKRLAIATLAVGTVCAALLMREPILRAPAQYVPMPAAAAPSAPAGAGGLRPALAAASPAADAGPRRIYPYSIVPGGVHGAAELGAIVKADKIVAQHYAGLRLDAVKVLTVTAPRAVYVSYRKGDQVYWTAKKLTLKAGETLLTDGTIELRARCGNMISDTPRLPVEAAGPGEDELDSSVEARPEGAVTEVAYALGADGNAPGSTYRLVNFGESGGIARAGGLLARGAFAQLAPAAAAPVGAMPAGMWRLTGGTESVAPADPASGVPAADADPAPGPAETAAPVPAPSTSPDVPKTDPAPPPGTTLLPAPAVDPVPVPVPVTEPVLVDENPQPPAAPPDPGTLPWPAPLPPVVDTGKDDTPQGEVPEPATPWLAGGALIAMLLALRRPRRNDRAPRPEED